MIQKPDGLPTQNEAHQMLYDLVQANGGDLRTLGDGVIDQIAAVVSANDADVKTVKQAISSKLGRLTKANKEDAESVLIPALRGEPGFDVRGPVQSGPPRLIPHDGITAPAGNGCDVFHILAVASVCKGGPFPGCRVEISAYGQAHNPPPDVLIYRWLYQITPDGNSHDFNGNVDGTLCTQPKGFCTWDELRVWLKENCGTVPPHPPIGPTCLGGQSPDPVTGECPPPPPPTPTCPSGQAPDPLTGECPPTPPTPPTPGSDCNSPLYVKLCTDTVNQTCYQPTDSNTTPTQSTYGIGVGTGGTLPSGNGSGGDGTPKQCSVPPSIAPISLPPIAECGLMPDGTLPPVGSPQWCTCIDNLRKWFGEIGAGATQFFGGAFAGLAGGVPGEAGNDFIKALGWALVGVPVVGSVLSGISNAISAQVATIGNNVGAAATGKIFAGGAEILGLSLCRTVLRLLRKMRVGCDLVVWITLDVELELAPIEKILDLVTNYVMATEIPSIQDAITAYKMNTASQELVRCWLALRGADFDTWLPVINAERKRLSDVETIQFMRRVGATDDEILLELRSLGYIAPVDAAARLVVYDELPSQADFLHYLQRNVYDTQYVQDYGLLEGFEERYWANFGDDLRAIGITKDRARLDYAAHWIRAAPEQFREFVYRNNPAYYQGPNPTSVEDYRRTLIEQDYAPYDVRRFVDTVYRVPALGYLRDMYRSYILSDDELKHYHQRLGYAETDSDNFVKIDKLVRSRMRASEGHGWSPGAIASAFSVGALQPVEVDSLMSALGYTADEVSDLKERATAELQRTIIVRARSRVVFSVLGQVKQALAVGAIDTPGAVSAVVGLGWPDQFAQGWVSIQSQAASVSMIKEGVRRIRSAFLAGEVDLNYVGSALSSLGIVPEALQRYVVLWQIEQTPRRRRRTAAQIVSDVSNGEISVQDALVRLTNLGYDDADRRLYLADAQRKILAREQSALAAEQRTELQRERELEKQQRAAERQSAELLAYRRRLSSPAKLQKWAVIGVIGRDVFFDRLRSQQFDDVDIERYWNEACKKRNAVCTETTPPVESPPANLGGSGYPPDQPN